MNRASILTLITVALSAMQTVMLHNQTTDFAHTYFSFYFFAEFFVLLITILSGLKQKSVVWLFILALLVESVWFFMNERPFSPDLLLMIVVGLVRVYIAIWLTMRILLT